MTLGNDKSAGGTAPLYRLVRAEDGALPTPSLLPDVRSRGVNPFPQVCLSLPPKVSPRQLFLTTENSFYLFSFKMPFFSLLSWPCQTRKKMLSNQRRCKYTFFSFLNKSALKLFVPSSSVCVIRGGWEWKRLVLRWRNNANVLLLPLFLLSSFIEV